MTIVFLAGFILGCIVLRWVQSTLGLFKPKGKSDPGGPTDGLPVRGAKWMGRKAAELIFGKPKNTGEKKDE